MQYVPTPEHLSFSFDSLPDAPPEGERWSSWDGATHGPKPRPDWVITALGAVESDLGVLKTGKEADVHVLRRWLPDGTTTPAVDSFLAAKRYRTGEHRMFHRDAGYQEGRRVRRSREMRAMARRTEFGKELLSGQWAMAEFEALGALWGLGLPVPYPVQLNDREMLMEFIGADGQAAPRLAQTRPEADLLADLFEQLRSTLTMRFCGRSMASQRESSGAMGRRRGDTGTRDPLRRCDHQPRYAGWLATSARSPRRRGRRAARPRRRRDPC
jgi:RIO kinase 1